MAEKKLRVVKNRDLDIQKVKMTCDNRPKTLNRSLQWNFASLIVGGPGSGKTSFYMNLISRKNKFYWRLFDRIVIFSPSLKTIGKQIRVKESDLFDGFDLEALENVIEEQRNTDENTLMILDDCVAELTRNMKPVLSAVFNRRHIGAGMSIMITTQKYTKVPLELRVAMSNIVMFNHGKKELDALFNEFVNLERPIFDSMTRFVFDKPHTFMYIDLLQNEAHKYHKNFDLITFDDSDI